MPDLWRSNPPGALVDQIELDRVLANWGTVPDVDSVAAGAVPEPATFASMIALVLVVAACQMFARSGLVA